MDKFSFLKKAAAVTVIGDIGDICDIGAEVGAKAGAKIGAVMGPRQPYVNGNSIGEVTGAAVGSHVGHTAAKYIANKVLGIF